MTERAADPRGSASLIGDIVTHLSNLLQSEIALAKSEISENLGRAGVAVGLLIGAMIIALTALNVLAAAVVTGLTALGIAPGWASLIVGVALSLIAYLLLRKGLNDLKLSSLAPSKTVENVRRDVATMKEKLHD
ncbi:phage holin family protein [Alphaproteobacteria bacterium GH1-50]|uniref:Phage holin family protein n=1 Tax=Kangsaoukella pontilimi TaxID=2691042 RepID=A0A7C9NEF0_9RHOB|nr:phage holin family protein [Kangsaoukella pontilimi]MXQ08119.1 phage holin family protein [Kangsaoukella pontilimi]